LGICMLGPLHGVEGSSGDVPRYMAMMQKPDK
jgi:hypothetical protein